MVRHEALGLIETFGLVFALEAADAMCKAANVDLVGYENVASGYITVIVTGDVGACRAAVDAGIHTVNNMEGSNIYSSLVLASPHADIQKIIEKYTLVI